MSNQYLLYTAFLLGSIGAYGTLTSEGSEGGTSSSSSGVSSVELQAIADRVLSVETWVNKKKESVRQVASDPNATPQEISESVLERLSDVESSAFTNDQNIFTLRTDVDQNISDISFNTGDLQGQITTNKTHADGIETTADTNASDITDIIKPELTSLSTNISGLETDLQGLGSRLDTIELARPLEATERETLASDILAVSGRVTANLDAIQSIEDDLELVYTANITSNADAIGALVDHSNYLSERLRADEDGVTCLGLFKAHNGVDMALSNSYLRMGDSNDDDWMVYTGNLAPGEQAAVAGYGFSGLATRLRVKAERTTGFVIENSNNERLMSVRGSDAFTYLGGYVQVKDGPNIFAADGIAYFGNHHFAGDAERHNYGLRQGSDGKTVVGSPSKVSICVGEYNMLFVESNKTTIEQELLLTNGKNRDTHFNFRGEGENVISSAWGKTTRFRCGTSQSTVEIKNKEVNIDGTDVLAKLKSLQAQIDALDTKMSSDYVKMDSEYYIQGHKDNWKSHLAYNRNDAVWGEDNTRMRLKIQKE